MSHGCLSRLTHGSNSFFLITAYIIHNMLIYMHHNWVTHSSMDEHSICFKFYESSKNKYSKVCVSQTYMLWVTSLPVQWNYLHIPEPFLPRLKLLKSWYAPAAIPFFVQCLLSSMYLCLNRFFNIYWIEPKVNQIETVWKYVQDTLSAIMYSDKLVGHKNRKLSFFYLFLNIHDSRVYFDKLYIDGVTFIFNFTYFYYV